ncbi:hypothetical protein LTR86_005861 [Recurvomyces mirabilis]|nr:hypothetical protein LTR86_005861 [Recurvomyces mirabilis]
MAGSTATIDRLPEELLLQIFIHLDDIPPSETDYRDEPATEVFESKQPVLKLTSQVSKRWRRVVLPLLFQHTRLRLDAPSRQEWKPCHACRRAIDLDYTVPDPDHGDVRIADPLHHDLCEDARLHLERHQSAHERGEASTEDMQQLASMRKTLELWLPRFHHHLQDFLNYLNNHDLTTKVQSFLLSTTEMLPDTLGHFPNFAAWPHDWRYQCSAAFWPHLLSSLPQLQRITVIAPPADLACLTNCAIDTSDMTFHILTLSLPPNPTPNKTTNTNPTPTPRTQSPAQPPPYASLQPHPHRYPGLAPSSLLHSLPWTAIHLNESAFLSAYGTYEFFERGPPSLLYSLLHTLTPRPTYGANMQRLSARPLESLRKLTYTAIFPFSTHLDFRELLPQLEELDLQLAPLMTSNILHDAKRVGKAELGDCWLELLATYRQLVAQTATFRISERSQPCLKKIVCRDMTREALREELDEVFMPLCLPVWAEMERGVFVRLRGSADVEEGMGQMVDW